MKKNNSRRTAPNILRIEQAMTQNWMGPASRTPYWTGSPWRALGQVFQR